MALKGPAFCSRMLTLCLH